MKIDRLLNLALFLIWGFFVYHFGIGQLVTYPRWEHYVVEGYFLFSTAVFTWMWFRVSGEQR